MASLADLRKWPNLVIYRKKGAANAMSRETDACHHLIDIVKGTVSDIVGRDSGPLFKFCFDMVFGILKSSSVVLNDVAHALGEKASIKTVNNRLYANLLRGLPDGAWSNFADACVRMMGGDLWFAVDDSDVQKPYGKAFESLSLVRDGSSTRKAEFGMGYMVTSIVGATSRAKHPMCLFTRIHSSAERNYLSANNVTNEGISKICAKLPPLSATFAFDRGYDDSKLMGLMLSLRQHFVIRMRGDRWLVFGGRRTKTSDLAAKRKGKIVVPIVYKGRETYVKASHVACKMPGVKAAMTVVFSYMEGKDDPMVLMTDRKVSSKEDLVRIVLSYHSRWKIEEHFRFKKTQYGFENFRVKSLESSNFLAFLLDVALLVLDIVIERRETNSLYSELMARAKVVREGVYLEFYRMATGARTLFMANKNGVKNYQNIRKKPDVQLRLFNVKDIKYVA